MSDRVAPSGEENLLANEKEPSVGLLLLLSGIVLGSSILGKCQQASEERLEEKKRSTRSLNNFMMHPYFSSVETRSSIKSWILKKYQRQKSLFKSAFKALNCIFM